MSNYPPGVTGNEYAIAGPDAEFDLDVTCADDGDGGAVSISVVDATARSALKNLQTFLVKALEAFDSGDADAARRWVAQAKGQAFMAGHDDVELERCPFVGTVTVQAFHGEMWWDCPLCGMEHRSERGEE